jgi:ASCH domain
MNKHIHDVLWSIMASKAELGIAKSTIKALSIGQPWAELILRHRKPYEIRSWKTHYRGLLLIHASRTFRREPAFLLGIDRDHCVVGAFVGWAELADVRPFFRKDTALLKQRKGGNGWWEPDQFAWVLKRVHRIDPIPYMGRLNLFDPPPSVARIVRRAVAHP